MPPRSLALIFTSIIGAGLCTAQQLTITADHTNGVYDVGQTIRWRAETDSTNGVTITLRKGGLALLGTANYEPTNGIVEFESKLDAPGTLLAEARTGTGRGGRALAGAVAAPDKIPLSAPRPADFDGFWETKLKELAAVPANPKLETGESGRTNVDYWKIMMDNIRGTHIYGQLARPAQGEKFPALLIVQWAGVYQLEKRWVTDRAAQGWLTLNIEPHDMPIDGRDEAGAFRNYWNIGNDDRDTSYFLRMYLSCYRAAQYLTERPDWNGQTLVVMGDSQGGQQALMTAGFHPKITAAIALVPAGCDMLGPDIGRRGGWPQWYDNAAGKDAQKVHEASRYFDVANFASRIKCPVLVGLGLIDETCPPAGVLAAANQITSLKEVMILPTSGHQNVRGSQVPFQRRRDNDWLPALRDGKVLPVKP